ncbi:MAG: regulator of protease activity HflC (stomatin/prohibitin superfamily) [Saprospiraceae bacterium]|jgi:regulator of protease activity HflC (stomatin/prohibitin superfamily)
MFTKLKVNTYEMALVYKDGALDRVLPKGEYWIWNRKVELGNMATPFLPSMDLDLLLKNEDLSAKLDVIEVKDNEIAVQMKNGNFHRVLTPGRYTYWKSVISYTYKMVNLSEVEISESINRKVLQRIELRGFVQTHVVESYEKGMLYVGGKYVKILDSGIYYYWKGDKAASMIKADLRKQQMEISGQELLTKDKAAVRVNFYASYQVSDIVKAMVDTKDHSKQFYILMQLGLREYVGKYTLDELLANKDSASQYVTTYAKEKALDMGVDVLSCGIRDVILPGDVREIMNQVLVAEKRAQANVIMRREETASTRSLLNTAKLMEDNEMLYKLKEMEYVEKIAENIQTISLSGGGDLVGQLKNIFGTAKAN